MGCGKDVFDNKLVVSYIFTDDFELALILFDSHYAGGKRICIFSESLNNSIHAGDEIIFITKFKT